MCLHRSACRFRRRVLNRSLAKRKMNDFSLVQSVFFNMSLWYKWVYHYSKKSLIQHEVKLKLWLIFVNFWSHKHVGLLRGSFHVAWFSNILQYPLKMKALVLNKYIKRKFPPFPSNTFKALKISHNEWISIAEEAIIIGKSSKCAFCCLSLLMRQHNLLILC